MDRYSRLIIEIRYKLFEANDMYKQKLSERTTTINQEHALKALTKNNEIFLKIIENGI